MEPAATAAPAAAQKQAATASSPEASSHSQPARAVAIVVLYWQMHVQLQANMRMCERLHVLWAHARMHAGAMPTSQRALPSAIAMPTSGAQRMQWLHFLWEDTLSMGVISAP